MRSASPGRTRRVGKTVDDDSIIFVNSFFSGGDFEPLPASCYDNERLIYQKWHDGKLLLLLFDSVLKNAVGQPDRCKRRLISEESGANYRQAVLCLTFFSRTAGKARCSKRRGFGSRA